jgi:hypothetical protein
MLADIYGWFTEGFDTVDLKDVNSQLDELAGIATGARGSMRCSKCGRIIGKGGSSARNAGRR